MNKEINNETEKEVLFQKLGSTWFVFSEVDDEVIYSTLPEGMDPYSIKLELFEVIEEHMNKVARHHRKQPEVA